VAAGVRSRVCARLDSGILPGYDWNKMTTVSRVVHRSAKIQLLRSKHHRPQKIVIPHMLRSLLGKKSAIWLSRGALSEIGTATVVSVVAAGLLSGYVIRGDQFPLGDSLYVYHVFYSTFTQLCQTGELPRWFPYSAFGMSADIRHLILPFLSIPVMEVLYVLGFKNAWYAFLLVLGIDFWLSSVGVYLLARQFSSRQVAGTATATPL
jgi:hypothetical protein